MTSQSFVHMHAGIQMRTKIISSRLSLCFYSGRKHKGEMGEVSHPQPRKFCVSQGKMVVKCTSARQFTGQRTIGELLLIKFTDKKSRRRTSETPLEFRSYVPACALQF